jgi:deoxyadenosine/deoxycytidine kinase
MGKLVAIVGITGAGKTSLVHALCQSGDYDRGLEQHTQRPFQSLFYADAHYALANQVDYLLQRAKQESQLRRSSRVALVDGGLDLDFHGFTRLFYARGLLNSNEFTLCEDLYTFLRSILPQPELFIRILIDHKVVTKRLTVRDRINIARVEDLDLFDRHIDNWVSSLDPRIILNVETSGEDSSYSRTTPIIMEKIAELSNK